MLTPTAATSVPSLSAMRVRTSSGTTIAGSLAGVPVSAEAQGLTT